MCSAIKARRSLSRSALAIALLAVLGWAAYSAYDEASTSRRQAAWLAERAQQQRYEQGTGPSQALHFPINGPFDKRLGYTQLPHMLERLQGQGFEIEAQARMSPQMLRIAELGLNPSYREKTQAGLLISDCRGVELHHGRHPQRVFERFEQLPTLLVDALLFIEDRQLLAGPVTRNPALDWSRLGKAMLDQGLQRLDADHPAGGGSTLATQIEKYRHSPGGRTTGPKDKLRQMGSASLRAYLDGPDSTQRRRQVLLDYLNTVPLSAQVRHGEVLGLGDGLWAWYGRDLAEVNALLSAPLPAPQAVLPPRRALAFREALLPRQALAYKQALSLLTAQRRPSYYLSPAGNAALRELTDSHLRLLARAGLIPVALRDAALPLPLRLVTPPAPDAQASFVDRKAATLLRTHLQQLLGQAHAYDLDRLDLAVTSPLSGALQQASTDLLRRLDTADPASGLYGRYLLQPGMDSSKIKISFTLYESADGVNLLRAQTDTVEQPFDLNQGARLDLGSTAKLRTLISYLEQVERLHQRWQGLDSGALEALKLAPDDAIALWVRQWLVQASERSLPALLDAALQRPYSASARERFFTGGGLHSFGNFDAQDNEREFTVGEAFSHSVNLVFVRLMRDLVRRIQADREPLPAADDAAARQQQLARFADREGSTFVARFYRKYAGLPAAEQERLLLQSLRPSPVRLAALLYAIEPEAGESELAEFLGRHLPSSETGAAALHRRYGPASWSLSDRAYLSGAHPLELWLLGHLRRQPAATLKEALQASVEQRQQAYEWLFKTRSSAAQDRRIRSMRELDAFAALHRDWQRLGYPFDALTPSYASALGASGDRPAALAELMGIIVNKGVLQPTARLQRLHFGTGTPYETSLGLRKAPGEQVLSREVAEATRRALLAVVEDGTGRRLRQALTGADGAALQIGGKTGTGDHRHDRFDSNGRLLSSRVVSRSATLVFMLGERHFGTLMAYVGEPDAAHYRFTSALPAQLLKGMSAQLQALIDGRTCPANDMPSAPEHR